MSQTIRILLADSNPYYRIGLCQLLKQEPDFAIVGETDDATDLLASWRDFNPDVILLDCRLAGSDGGGAGASLDEPELLQRVITISAAAADPILRRLVQSGAPGCVLRLDTIETIATAVRAVAAGQGWISPPIAAYVPAWLQANTPDSSRLNERELQVLALVAQGLTNQMAALKLGLSPRTVDYHLNNALTKLNASNRTVAVLEAIRRGWLEL